MSSFSIFDKEGLYVYQIILQPNWTMRYGWLRIRSLANGRSRPHYWNRGTPNKAQVLFGTGFVKQLRVATGNTKAMSLWLCRPSFIMAFLPLADF
jgi:hypothetical protein